MSRTVSILMILAAPSWAAIATIPVTIGSGDGSVVVDVDLGDAAAEVLSIAFSATGVAHYANWQCNNCAAQYHGVDCVYEEQLPMHLNIWLHSGLLTAGGRWEQQSEGAFVAQGAVFTSTPLAEFFPGGRGQLYITYGAYYADFQWWCDYIDGAAGPVDPGALVLDGDLVVAIEYTPSVPVSNESWGFVKARFR